MKTNHLARQRTVLAWLLALALAFGLNPTFALAAQADGGQPSSDVAAASEQTAVTATMAVYGPDGDASAAWLPLSEWTAAEGATAADMTEALFEANDIVADIQDTQYGFYLNSITGADGTVYGWNAETGAYWGLYVNGVASPVGADGVELQPGDCVVWYYGPYAESLPDLTPGYSTDADVVAADAAWSQFAGGNGGVAGSALPTTERAAQSAWKANLLTDAAAYAYTSDPLVVDGVVYVAESDSVWGSPVAAATLRAFDAETGALLGEAALPYGLDYFCRMAYVDGVIAVPTAGGGLLCVSANSLVDDQAGGLNLRWYVAPSIEGAQSLNTVSVHDGYFVHTYSQLDADYKAAKTVTVAINASTGACKWRAESEVGSYWGGAAFVGDVMVIGDDAGTLKSIDFASGVVLDQKQVAETAGIRSTVVNYGDDQVVFTTSDGRLVKARVDAATGAIEVTGSVAFADSSTSTPAIAGSTAVVGGARADYTGVLASVDLETMAVTAEHAAAADVKSAPVVAQGHDGAWYAYYTCNTMPGALFGVQVGAADAQPFVVCEPEASERNYCTASAVSDGEGRLFYTNDSGTLFAVDYDRTCGFEDVPEDGWYVQDGSLESVLATGLMEGTASNEFSPNEQVTRAMVVTVLYRAAGSPSYDAVEPFPDVVSGDASAWYYDAVMWARATGITTGNEDGTFGPDVPVTREQLGAFLGRYAQMNGASMADVDQTAFEALPDRSSAAAYAQPYLAWCCANGVITGDAATGEPLLNPQGDALRCMLAKMLVKTLAAL